MTTKLHKYSAPLKRMLPAAIWQPARALLTGIVTPIRFSQKTGHWKSSLRMSACSSNGAPIPWYTYPAIDFLMQRNFEDRNVLEFGGGELTLWWSMRARSVLTIENKFPLVRMAELSDRKQRYPPSPPFYWCNRNNHSSQERDRQPPNSDLRRDKHPRAPT